MYIIQLPARELLTFFAKHTMFSGAKFIRIAMAEFHKNHQPEKETSREKNMPAVNTEGTMENFKIF